MRTTALIRYASPRFAARFAPFTSFAPLLAVALMACSGLVACSSAPLSENGGEALFDAAPSDDDASVCSATSEDAGSGTEWSDLYRDYFGPTGKASCAGTGQCHGSTSQAGYLSSNYACPDTADACYAGITATTVSPQLVTVGDTTSDPTTSNLYLTLRKCSGSGPNSMPQQPATLMFTTGDMARIAAWIKAGAPND